MCDLKTTEMNVNYSLIWKLMLYELKLDHDVMKVTKNTHYSKGTIYQPLRSGRIWHKVNF